MLKKWILLNFRKKRQLLSPFSSSIFSKPSVSAAKLSSDEPAISFDSVDQTPADPVPEIIANLRNLGFKKFIDGDDSKNLILRLSEFQVDRIIDCLRVESLDLAVTFFDWLKIHCGFKHSLFASFVIAHVLAAKRSFKELRLVLEQILQEKGFFFFFNCFKFFTL